MIPFMKEGLDKLGVKMNVFYAGDFKSATEPFRRNNMSPQNKIQTREYLSDYYNDCLLYTSPSPRDATLSRMPSSA